MQALRIISEDHSNLWRLTTTIDHVAGEIEDGAPVCAQLLGRDGLPLLAPFKSSWVALRSRDKRCTYCRRVLRDRIGPH